jgi:hypothetical protein
MNKLLNTLYATAGTASIALLGGCQSHESGSAELTGISKMYGSDVRAVQNRYIADHTEFLQSSLDRHAQFAAALKQEVPQEGSQENVQRSLAKDEFEYMVAHSQTVREFTDHSTHLTNFAPSTFVSYTTYSDDGKSYGRANWTSIGSDSIQAGEDTLELTDFVLGSLSPENVHSSKGIVWSVYKPKGDDARITGRQALLVGVPVEYAENMWVHINDVTTYKMRGIMDIAANVSLIQTGKTKPHVLQSTEDYLIMRDFALAALAPIDFGRRAMVAGAAIEGTHRAITRSIQGDELERYEARTLAGFVSGKNMDGPQGMLEVLDYIAGDKYANQKNTMIMRSPPINRIDVAKFALPGKSTIEQGVLMYLGHMQTRLDPNVAPNDEMPAFNYTLTEDGKLDPYTLVFQTNSDLSFFLEDLFVIGIHTTSSSSSGNTGGITGKGPGQAPR